MLHFDILKPREWIGEEIISGGPILIIPVSAESHSRPHIVAHAQWCSALALVHSASVSSLRGGVKLAGLRCVFVCARRYNSPPSASRRPSARHGNRASGFLFQPRVSHACSFLEAASRVFLFCSCQGEKMLIFNFFVCRLQKNCVHVE